MTATLLAQATTETLNPTVTPATNVNVRFSHCRRVGKTVMLSILFDIPNINNTNTVMTVSGIPLPAITVYAVAGNGNGYRPISFNANGTIIANGDISAKQWLGVTFTYLSQ